MANGAPYAGTAYNPQVGGVSGAQVHVVLNGSAWYDDDSNPAPLEKNSPANASICNAKVVDVKLTEDNSFPFASLIPLFPDIKRKARVEIQEIEGLSGLLPVRGSRSEAAQCGRCLLRREHGVGPRRQEHVRENRSRAGRAERLDDSRPDQPTGYGRQLDLHVLGRLRRPKQGRRCRRNQLPPEL